MENKIATEVVISIIVPIYNAELRLINCLESICNQTYDDFEVLLIDDGSKDKSGEICDRFCEKDTRFTVFHIENSGVSSARNLGIKHSNGEFLVFIDADDYIAQDYIEKLLNGIQLNNAGMAICDIDYYCRENNFVRIQNDEFIRNDEFLSRYIRNLKTGQLIGAPYARIFRKKIIEDNNILYEEGQSYAEDFMFNLKYYCNIKSIQTISLKLYKYYEGDVNSLSNKNLNKIEYIYNRQMGDIYNLLDFFTSKYLNTRDILNEFIIYFTFRDIGIICKNKGYKKIKLIKKIISNDKFRNVYSKDDKIIKQGLCKIEILSEYIYIIFRKAKLDLIFFPFFINIIYKFFYFISKVKG